MLAIRYALMFPGEADQLVLVDPVGLEDWQAKGVPWISVDRWYRGREEDHGGQHPRLRAGDLLRGTVATGV